MPLSRLPLEKFCVTLEEAHERVHEVEGFVAVFIPDAKLFRREVERARYGKIRTGKAKPRIRAHPLPPRGMRFQRLSLSRFLGYSSLGSVIKK